TKHPGNRDRSALREERRQPLAPEMLGHEEDQGGRHRSGYERVSEDETERPLDAEHTELERSDDTPDQAGKCPAAERDPGARVREHQCPSSGVDGSPVPA